MESLKRNDIEKILDEVEKLYFNENQKLEDAIRIVKEKRESDQN